jgi:uncharacterized protein
VLILLPPSESKATARRGRPLDLAALSFPELHGVRASLLDGEIASAPAMPARRLYTGVLYGALDLATIPASEARQIVIVSAQYGALRPGDRVAPYRRTMEPSRWRAALDPVLTAAAGRAVVLDCRSETYAAAWRPPPAVAARTVRVSVVEERGGVRRIVSHMAKRTRGEVVRHLLITKARPKTPPQLAAAVRACFACELTPPAHPGVPWTLVVVERRPDFVPPGFVPPAGLAAGDVRLEPLGAHHNERDHTAWSSSIAHIHATPGFADGDDPWPTPMTLHQNLGDLEMHARHFRDRTGFTYTVLDRDGDVVGCVYIYPGSGPRTAAIRSWVRASHAHLDRPVHDAVSSWAHGPAWPFTTVTYAPRPT